VLPLRQRTVSETREVFGLHLECLSCARELDTVEAAKRLLETFDVVENVLLEKCLGKILVGSVSGGRVGQVRIEPRKLSRQEGGVGSRGSGHSES